MGHDGKPEQSLSILSCSKAIRYLSISVEVDKPLQLSLRLSLDHLYACFLSHYSDYLSVHSLTIFTSILWIISMAIVRKDAADYLRHRLPPTLPYSASSRDVLRYPHHHRWSPHGLHAKQQPPPIGRLFLHHSSSYSSAIFTPSLQQQNNREMVHDARPEQALSMLSCSKANSYLSVLKNGS
jgi:hypothetical protein